MPLKDLRVNTAELAEKWVEEIVAPYVNYDVDSKRIILLPASASLSNKKKVLVFLAALQGWPFITEEAIPVEATPAQVGEALNIQGGTLRPVLKELKDSNLVSVNGRTYSISVAALLSIKKEVSVDSIEPNDPQVSKSVGRKPKGSSNKGAKRKIKASGGNTEFLNKEIAGGFFDEPKVISDVVNRFHETGRIVHKGVVSPLLLKAVKAEKLQRRKSEAKGRKVWVYETAR